MRKWRKGLLAMTVAALGVVLTACGGGSTTESTDAVPADDSTFTMAIGADPTSTNPITTSDRWGLTVTNMIYSPLAMVDGDGVHQNVLAESVEPAEDGLSVTVHLRQDVLWSDGEPLTAEDVIFTYEQKVKPENGNSDSLWIGDEPITFEQVDEFTVKFNLPQASAAAINNITTETFIIPKHVFQDVEDFSVNELPVDPVGTGPFKLVEYNRGQYLRFEANENYFGGKPSIQNVILRIIESADTTRVALQKGEVDAAVVLPSEVGDLDESMITTFPYSENRVGYMGLNTISEGLEDVRVRQAILFALNKNEMNMAAYLSEDYFEQPNSFLPPNNPFATTDVETYETNIEKAKELLAEAGVTDLSLNLAFSSTDPAQTIQATLIQQQLQQVGINVQLEGGDGTAIFAELNRPGSTRYNLFLGGYIMGNDPDLYSALFASGGSANYFQINNPEIDALFEQGATEMDEAKRKEIYAELQRVLADYAAIYPIVDNKRILAVNNRIGNVEAAGLIPIYTFADMSQLTIN